jgi:hypothetical protein
VSYRRSSVKGAASFRRLLKQLPDTADQKLLALLRKAGPALAVSMQATVPERTGFGRSGISWRLTPGTKTLKVGVLVPRISRSDYFYLHILDVGRKAQTVTIKRGPRAGAPMRVPAYKALRIVYKGMQQFRGEFLPAYRTLMNEILLTAARGVGDD